MGSHVPSRSEIQQGKFHQISRPENNPLWLTALFSGPQQGSSPIFLAPGGVLPQGSYSIHFGPQNHSVYFIPSLSFSSAGIKLLKNLLVFCRCNGNSHHQAQEYPIESSQMTNFYFWLLLRQLIGSINHMPDLFSKQFSCHILGSVYRTWYLDRLRIFQIIKCKILFA